MDYDLVAQQLLIQLRRSRSQVQWSRRLGYRSNVAYPWETGRRSPMAAETLRAAGRAGVDVEAAMRRFYDRADLQWMDEVAVDTPAGVARLLDDLRGKATVSHVARTSGCSRTAVSRWLSGAAQP